MNFSSSGWIFFFIVLMYYVVSYLQYHFTTDMWEKPRIDATNKLKHNAIPTIFGDLVYQVKIKEIKVSIWTAVIVVKYIIIQYWYFF